MPSLCALQIRAFQDAHPWVCSDTTANPLLYVIEEVGPMLTVTDNTLFIYWLCWVFFFSSFSLFCFGSLLLQGPSLVMVSRGYSLLWCMDFSLRSFSCCRAGALGCVGFSSWGSWALEHRLSSCGARTYLLHGVWNLYRPGIEPMSPALAGGFLSTVPPGKSSGHTLEYNIKKNEITLLFSTDLLLSIFTVCVCCQGSRNSETELL